MRIKTKTDYANYYQKLTHRVIFRKKFYSSVSVAHGKVRDIFTIKSPVSGAEQLLIVTSDRLSAFDRVLTTIPCKGEVLNRTSLFWFDQTRDIIPNHILRPVSARSVLVNKYQVLPIEVVVRGYLTGSAWRDYQAGKPISGIRLPAGLRFNGCFPEPLLTPTTKEASGHDQPIPKRYVRQGLLPAHILEKVEKTALALFKRGYRTAGQARFDPGRYQV